MKEVHEKGYCSDCGEVPISHRGAKIADRIDLIVEQVTQPLTHISETLLLWIDRLPYERPLAAVLDFLARIHVGEMAHTFDARDSVRTRAVWESAEKEGVALRQYRFFKSQSYGTIIAEKNGRMIIFRMLPRPKGFKSPSLSWMDDKGILKKKLRAADLPTSDGASCATLAQAKQTYARVQPPVIAKPHLGTRGRHTTLNIDTEEKLERAFRIGAQISARVVIEEELQGHLYRVTLVGGKPSAVARRDPPHVIGDGTLTVRELMDRANADPRRDGFMFSPLLENDRMEYELSRQGLTIDSIPENGRFVILNDKVSRLHGTTTVDVTDDVHPDNMQLFADLGSFLGDAIVGVDFIMADIARPHTEQSRYGVVECNAMPYVDLHHYPFEGQPREVGRDLWRLVFTTAN